MKTINYYTDTLIECEVAKLRLKTLLEKKEVIYQKYFGLKSPVISDDKAFGGYSNKDKMIEYLEEIEEKKVNGISLQQEINMVEAEIESLEDILAEMRIRLAKLTNIEDKLYYEIIVNKRKVTEAVNYISETCYTSDKNIWKTYYPKIKSDIYRIRRISEKVE